MMNRVHVFFFVLGIMVFPGMIAHAGDHYVRPNGGSYGSQNGSDWNNAFNGLSGISWSSITGGETIWVAGGTYTAGLYGAALSFSKGGASDGSRIIVKRATSSAHGTDTGWSSGFDSQVLLNNATIDTHGYNNITIDGQVDNGIKVSHTSGYGISTSADSNLTGSSNVTLRYIAVVGGGPGSDCNHQGWHSTGGNNVLVEYCNMSSYPSAVIRADVTNLTFRYNTIHDSDNGGSSCHNDLFISYYGSGSIHHNMLYNTLAAGLAFDDNSGPWYIHNNLIYQTGSYIGDGNLIECQRNTNLYVYNNTIANGDHGVDTSVRTTPSSGEVKNNIFYNNKIHVLKDSPGSVTYDYNWYSGSSIFGGDVHGIAGGTTNPFTNSSTFNWTLKAGSTPIDKGVSLGSSYSVDYAGNIRSGSWDIGAYELKLQIPIFPKIMGITN